MAINWPIIGTFLLEKIFKTEEKNWDWQFEHSIHVILTSYPWFFWDGDKISSNLFELPIKQDACNKSVVSSKSKSTFCPIDNLDLHSQEGNEKRLLQFSQNFPGQVEQK